MTTVRVLAVVDSAVLREKLREGLTEARGIVLVLAADPAVAEAKLGRSPADVVLIHQPMPDAEPLVARLHASGVPTVDSTLPHPTDPQLDAAIADRLREVAFRSRTPRTELAPVPRSRAPTGGPSDLVIAFGSSTGGTDALRAVLSTFSADTPGIVAVQHMPGAYTAAFAAHLDRTMALRVREARDGDLMEAGTVLVAAGGVTCRSFGSERALRSRCSTGR